MHYSWTIVPVALRKESVDRNALGGLGGAAPQGSLSARRAWIEMFLSMGLDGRFKVALRKESVDRNTFEEVPTNEEQTSLSARRAWIEIGCFGTAGTYSPGRSPQGERG